jgi:hypothetical protein
LRKGAAKLSEIANQREVHRIAGQAIAGHGVAGHALALEHLEAHAHSPRQNEIRRDTVGEA